MSIILFSSEQTSKEKSQLVFDHYKQAQGKDINYVIGAITT